MLIVWKFSTSIVKCTKCIHGLRVWDPCCNCSNQCRINNSSKCSNCYVPRVSEGPRSSAI